MYIYIYIYIYICDINLVYILIQISKNNLLHSINHEFQILFARVNVIVPCFYDVLVVDDLGFVFVLLHETSHSHEIDVFNFAGSCYRFSGQTQHGDE